MKKKKDEITIRSSAAEYLTYVAAIGDQQDSIEMRYEDENIWLTQKMMATLYDVSVAAINQHIKKVYDDSELEPESTIKKYLIVQTEGSCQVSREVAHYNLQIKRAMIACENSGHDIASDFPEVRKIVEAGATNKPVVDYELTRYACYLIVQNLSDRRKTAKR